MRELRLTKKTDRFVCYSFRTHVHHNYPTVPLFSAEPGDGRKHFCICGLHSPTQTRKYTTPPAILFNYKTGKPAVHILFCSVILVKYNHSCPGNVLFRGCEGLPLWVFWGVSLVVPLAAVYPALVLEGPFSIWRKLFLWQSEPDQQLEVV